MLYVQCRRDARRHIFRLLCSTILAAAVAGCANTPKARGVPWWPQGPGDAAASNTAPTARHAETAHSSVTQPAHGYAQAVRYGDLFFLSGQIADDPVSLAIVGTDIETQVHSAMDNVVRILESHGLTSSNILSITLYLQDIDKQSKADTVVASYFQRSLPAHSVVHVKGLPKGSLVEVSVIAGK